eukprot:TRINITY_DN16526_c0_g1_i1.p1 TRINITY_DN16526_c0_g1~~TRINITY_DN16526_c0_g1_i1.p1  ORF type:complete len:133 (+),score=27.56 TRINITY_DN16526_c0_g1_i1:53-451(+)
MKFFLSTFFIILVLLFVSAMAQEEGPVCRELPVRFQSGFRSDVYDEKQCMSQQMKGDVQVDFESQLVRLDLFETTSEESGNVTVWMNYKEKTMYEFDHKKRTCQKKTLSSSLGSNKLPSSTKLLGNSLSFIK